jgi:hypothetical protein
LGLPSLPPDPRNTWISVLLRLVILAALGAGAWYGLHALPNSLNPFSPIELTDETNALTNVKLRVLQHRYEACIATIKRRSIDIVRDRIFSKDPSCGTNEGVRLKQSLISYGGGVEATCGLMAALMIWERHSVLPKSQDILGSPVTRVRTYGTYSCRNVNHALAGRRSEHATGNAIDIAGFDLADGRKISVVKDWGKDTDEGRFLIAVHDDACGIFSAVLGPKFNKLHANHFHFDMGIWSICR